VSRPYGSWTKAARDGVARARRRHGAKPQQRDSAASTAPAIHGSANRRRDLVASGRAWAAIEWNQFSGGASRSAAANVASIAQADVSVVFEHVEDRG
jgi:hypothetical protein